MAEAVADNVPAKATPIDGKPPLFGLSFLENLSEMTMLRQVGLLVGLAASVAIGFAVVLWSQQPDYRPLYGSLAGMDAKQVMDTLASADIPYTVEPNSGALLVKADDLSRARHQARGCWRHAQPTAISGLKSSTRTRAWAPASSWRPRATVVALKASWPAPSPA